MHSAYGPATPQKWWRDPASANEAQSAANNLAIPFDVLHAKEPFLNFFLRGDFLAGTNNRENSRVLGVEMKALMFEMTDFYRYPFFHGSPVHPQQP